MEITKLLKTLGDETRFRIVLLLRTSSFTVNEILFVIGGNQSNISHHLKTLADASIVESKKEGSWIYYKLSAFFKQNFGSWLNSLDSQWFPSKSESDVLKVAMVLSKRQEHAERYFTSINEAKQVELLNFLDKILSTEEIEQVLDGNYNCIVDLGCGTGRNLESLSKFCKMVVGIDASERMLLLAQHLATKAGLNYQLINADVTKLPLLDSSVDAVLINMVLHHIPDPKVALAETKRILSPDGKLFLVELLEHSDETLRDSHGDLWLGFAREEIESWISELSLNVTSMTEKQHGDFRVLIYVAQKS